MIISSILHYSSFSTNLFSRCIAPLAEPSSCLQGTSRSFRSDFSSLHSLGSDWPQGSSASLCLIPVLSEAILVFDPHASSSSYL